MMHTAVCVLNHIDAVKIWWAGLGIDLYL